MTPRDYGVIAKCPHCDKTGIKRTVHNQDTCGKIQCKNKAQCERKRRLRESKAAEANA